MHVQPSDGALLLSKDSEVAFTSQLQKIGHPDKVRMIALCVTLNEGMSEHGNMYISCICCKRSAIFSNIW